MNHLQNAASPYLLQHAKNPVDWYPWSEAPFARAKKENKPVLVSIGYAACHWCHVMEHESFENEETAAFMNAHFICIKVDREEHPDVDHFYMDALQSLSGSGGWPLNMFVTPEKKPFYGGTYFPPRKMYNRSSWMEILQAINHAWKNKPEEIALQAEQMIQHLRQASAMGLSRVEGGSFPDDYTTKIAENLLLHADKEWGGFGAAPKFPATFSILFLLEYYHYQKEKEVPLNPANEALDQALLSLDRMIGGGIYDQVGGGFSRYSTDKYWLAPHFEKMLYDNALLVSLLAAAYRITGNGKYKNVLTETLDFCDRELRDTYTGGYYCALDADSEGIEGRFYTWTAQQWKEALPDAHPALVRYFGIEEAGNWEHTNILWRAKSEPDLLSEYALTAEEWEKLLKAAKLKLFRKRSERVRPATDDKLLLSWNALMNIALSNAAVSLKSPDLTKRAEAHLNWMMEAYNGEPGLKHAYKNGNAYIEANLDDYAYLINALLQFSAASGKAEYVLQAVKLTACAEQLFANEETDFFYFSGKAQSDIIVRKIELYDGPTPAANAVMAENLMILGALTDRKDWIVQSRNMFCAMQETVSRYGRSFSYWAIVLQRWQQGIKQLVITGAGAQFLLREWQQYYYPEVFALSQETPEGLLPLMKEKFLENENLLYLCRLFECGNPVRSVRDLLKELKKMS